MRRTPMAMVIAALACSLGCTDVRTRQGTPADRSNAVSKQSEDEMKQGFASLQAAIQSRDAARIWDLLADDSRQDAEREAKAIKEAFAKLGDEEKSAYETRTGLSAKDIANLSGKGYLKSKAFFTGEVEELPGSQVERVVVAGDSGTVHYTEEQGQKERITVVRERGQWGFAVPVPKAVLK